jgi:hypothetical protein
MGPVESICLKCLEKDPQRRHNTADGLAEYMHCQVRARLVFRRNCLGVVGLTRATAAMRVPRETGDREPYC